MSLFKIDGYVLPVNEIYTWIAGFVTLSRKGWIKSKEIPKEVAAILKQDDDKEVVQDIMVYLKKDEDYLKILIDIVKEGMTELAIEKSKKSRQ